MTEFIGLLAALGTAISFAFTSTFFTFAGRQIGSPLVNRTRLLVAIICVIGLHWLLRGEPLPFDAAQESIFWLGLSGFVGLALGDALLFQAFVMIGPRLSMLIMALAPVLSVVMAWLLLGEALTAQELAGILLTVGGIGIVVSERQGKSKDKNLPDTRREYLIGLLFALGGATGQAGGAVLSKMGLANDFPPLSGNLIRISVALIAIWAFTALRGQLIESARKLRANPRATAFLTAGAITGPVIGVWLSLIAFQRAPVGIASALIALTPIFLLPIGYFVFQERIGKQAIIGTFLAFGGTVLIFI